VSEVKVNGLRNRSSKYRDDRLSVCSWEGCHRAYFHKKDLARHIRINHINKNKDADVGEKEEAAEESSEPQCTVLTPFEAEQQQLHMERLHQQLVHRYDARPVAIDGPIHDLFFDQDVASPEEDEIFPFPVGHEGYFDQF